MQKLTKLKADELREKTLSSISEERTKLRHDLSRNGNYGGSVHGQLTLKISFQQIEQFFEEIFKIEKMILAKNPDKTNDSYWLQLEDEFKNLINLFFDEVLKEIKNIFPKNHSNFDQRITQEQSKVFNSIMRRIEMLKEELQLGLLDSNQTNAINVAGDVGAINTGNLYGSIEVKLKTIENPSLNEIKEAFQEISKACRASDIDEEEKGKQLQNIVFLLDQTIIFPEQRNKGVIQTITDYLSTASNLTSVWGQFGPPILKFFGL